MTPQEAREIINRESLCVDRECNIERSCSQCDLVMPSKEPILEAYNMATKALEQIERIAKLVNELGLAKELPKDFDDRFYSQSINLIKEEMLLMYRFGIDISNTLNDIESEDEGSESDCQD